MPLWYLQERLPNFFAKFLTKVLEVTYILYEYASNIHNCNTRYASKQNLYKRKVKTNTDKQAVSFILIDLWKELPDELKLLNSFSFIKQLKDHLLSSQRE